MAGNLDRLKAEPLASTSSTKPTPLPCPLTQIEGPVSSPPPLCLTLSVQSINKLCQLQLQDLDTSQQLLASAPRPLLTLSSKSPTSPDIHGSLLASPWSPGLYEETIVISLQDVNQITTLPLYCSRSLPHPWIMVNTPPPLGQLVRFLAKKMTRFIWVQGCL